MANQMRHVTTRNARLMQVIETVSIRGDGTERDPVREVRQYWSCNEMHPELLAEHDPQHQRSKGCHCPAEPGQGCPLTAAECAART